MARVSTPSSTSTMSCIEVEANASELASSTPPTSVTDSGSISSKSFLKDDEQPVIGRARRVRTSAVNYNETVLSGKSIVKKRKSINTSKSSGDVEGNPSSDREQQHLVHETIEVMSVEWTEQSLSHDQEQDTGKSKKSFKSRFGADSALLKRATSLMSKTKTILGKRGRDAMDLGVSKAQSLGKRASLRVRDQTTKQVEMPAEKKIKITQQTEVVQTTVTTQTPRKPVKIPTTKRWLAKGLYVGQDPDFDPRMTDTKNKIKKASTAKPATKQRKILPLPMFAGKRLLETGRPFQLPFDVFNPLPNGQPKPEEWRKVGKNVFFGDSAEIWRHTKLTEMSKCLCTPDVGCDEDCINRTMFYECDNSNCNVGVEHCGNRSFEELRKRVKAGGKYNIGVEVCKTKEKGYGVRSNRTFQPNQIIVEYTGEIITPEECDRRMYDEYKDNECFYLMVFDQNMIIDATRGSIARFVNHSCEPNCKMVKWTVAGKPRMALFAGDKGVMTGEELTYDYNFDPFSSKNIQSCRCGTPSCRGVLGPKPKEAKEIKELSKPAPAKSSTKRKIAEVIDNVTGGASTKKRRIAVAKSVKKAVSSVKASATKQLNKAAVQKASASKKIAERKINRAKTKKTNVRFKARASNVAQASPRKNAKASASGTVKRGVVRTVKGKNGGRSRTIRVIAK